MVSAFWDEYRGFGLPLTLEEIVAANTRRAASGELPLILAEQSPGLIFFQYGKNKDGYWDGEHFQKQCIDIMDVKEHIYPESQILLEVDRSSGHLKEQSNGLMTNAMGLKWGGKTTAKRDTVIEEGCLGTDVPIVNGLKLTIGVVQKMTFQVGDQPHFKDLNAIAYDREMNEAEKAKELIRRQKRSKTAYVEAEDAEPFLIYGYVGQNKGIYQVLHERGLYKPKMQHKEQRRDLKCKANKTKYCHGN